MSAEMAEVADEAREAAAREARFVNACRPPASPVMPLLGGNLCCCRGVPRPLQRCVAPPRVCELARRLFNSPPQTSPLVGSSRTGRPPPLASRRPPPDPLAPLGLCRQALRQRRPPQQQRADTGGGGTHGACPPGEEPGGHRGAQGQLCRHRQAVPGLGRAGGAPGTLVGTDGAHFRLPLHLLALVGPGLGADLGCATCRRLLFWRVAHAALVFPGPSFLFIPRSPWVSPTDAARRFF